MRSKMNKGSKAARATSSRIKARLDRQTTNNSYSPKLFYEDKPFICRDCGAECIWTAEQQRLWYEEWKGTIYSMAVRCRTCRQKVRAEKIKQKQHMAKMSAQKKRIVGC